MSDLNEGFYDDEGTNDILCDIGLINILQDRYAEVHATYIHGSKAIDHVWMTGDIYPYVTNVGLAPHRYICSSDHRPIVFDVRFEEFLGAKEIWIHPLNNRR